MEYDSELAKAVLMEREAEKNLADCRRRVNELIGLVDEKEQRKPARKTLSSKEFQRACGL